MDNSDNIYFSDQIFEDILRCCRDQKFNELKNILDSENYDFLFVELQEVIINAIESRNLDIIDLIMSKSKEYYLSYEIEEEIHSRNLRTFCFIVKISLESLEPEIITDEIRQLIRENLNNLEEYNTDIIGDF